MVVQPILEKPVGALGEKGRAPWKGFTLENHYSNNLYGNLVAAGKLFLALAWVFLDD